MGFDLLYNMEAAAHKIGVNLIRKRRHYWFSKEKWHQQASSEG